MKNNDRLLNTHQAAQFIGVSVKTIRNWAQTKIITGMKIGPRGDWRFTKEDLNKMIINKKGVNPR